MVFMKDARSGRVFSFFTEETPHELPSQFTGRRGAGHRGGQNHGMTPPPTLTVLQSARNGERKPRKIT